jgi:hypothetical protein
MKFVEKTSMMRRGPTAQSEPEDCETPLLVGEFSVFSFEENHSDYGHDDVTVTPAYLGEKRGFLVKKSWSPGFGYCAYGEEESFVPLREGIETILTHGGWDFNPA